MLNPGNSATMTANEVIAAALTELGVLAAGEEPSGDDFTLGLRTLNFMLKTWTARGVNLWREQTEQFTVPAITGSVDLPTRVQDVIDARLVNSPNYERQLQRYQRSQYLMLPNKAARGVPTIFYADKQRETVTLRLWPLPGGPVTIAVDYARAPADVLESSDEIDVPRQWLETVWVALAARLSGAYGMNSLDATTVALVAQHAASLEQLLLDYDRPASVFMGPMEGSRF